MIPRFKFMFAKQGDSDVFNRKTLAGFIYEPKFDGTRVMIYKEDDDIELLDTKNEDIIRLYPELLDVPNNIKARQAVLDGIIVILNKESKPSLALLEEREHLKGKKRVDSHVRKNPATLFIFDIIYKDGNSLVELSLEKRKQELQKTVVESPLTKICPFTSNGQELWQRTEATGINGVMAKDLSSKYEQGKRTWTWLKIKKEQTANVVIAGFSKGQDKKLSLMLSCFQKDKPVVVGKIEDMQGFDNLRSRKLMRMMNKLITRKQGNKSFIVPKLIAQVKFEKIETNPEKNEKKLIEPSLLRLRNDKNPEDCTLEE